MLDAGHDEPTDHAPLLGCRVFDDLAGDVGTEQRFEWSALFALTLEHPAVICGDDKGRLENSALFPWGSAHAFLALSGIEQVEVCLPAFRFQFVFELVRVRSNGFDGLVNQAVLDPGLSDQRALDLRSGLVTTAIECSGEYSLCITFADCFQRFAISLEYAVRGDDDACHVFTRSKSGMKKRALPTRQNARSHAD